MAATQPFRLLYVCAGNVARSPLAAACTRLYVQTHGTPQDWQIESAGTHATPDECPRAEAIRIAESFGLDLQGHVARQLDPERVDDHDLILAMSWDQAAHLWSAAPGSWGHSFTLREFIHWAKQVPPRPQIIFPDRMARMRDRVEQAHALRRRARADHGFWGGLRPQDLNVIEPEGKGEGAWRSFAQAIRTLTTDVVHLLGGP